MEEPWYLFKDHIKFCAFLVNKSIGNTQTCLFLGKVTACFKLKRSQCHESQTLLGYAEVREQNIPYNRNQCISLF